MVHTPTSVPVYRQTVWSSLNRPFRLHAYSSTPTLQQFILGSRNGRGGRIAPTQLALRNKFCQPTIQATSKGSGPYPTNQSRSYGNSAFLASPTMAISSARNVSVSSPETSLPSKNVCSMSRFYTRGSKKPEVVSVCMESEWKKCLECLNWPVASIEVYKHYIADSTRKQYDRYLSEFKSFCIQTYGCFPPEEGFVSAAIAGFLTEKSKLSQRPESMLRGIVAALTNYFDIPGRRNPMTHEIRNLVKALIKKETTLPAGRTKIMRIEHFTSLFEGWGANVSLSIPQLRQKSLTLLALVCMARPSDFAPNAGFYRDQFQFHENGSATIHFFGVKNDANRTGFEVRIEGTENPYIDAVSCVKQYFCKTSSQVNDQQRAPAFLSLKPPFKGISAQSIAQILNASIGEAGLNTQLFSAKCFRPSAATAAVVAGCDPNTTRVRGRWKNHQVFFANYVYPVSKVNVSQKILTSDCSIV